MITLTRAERLMLFFLTKDPLPTWVLTGHLTPEHLSTFNHLHKAGLVEPVTSEMRAYHANAAGRAALQSTHGSSFFDQTYRIEEDA